MKFHIKEQIRKIVYPEIIDLRPPTEPIKIKGAHKKVISILSDNSTKWPPSYFEHVATLYPDSLIHIPKEVLSKLLALVNYHLHNFYNLYHLYKNNTHLRDVYFYA